MKVKVPRQPRSGALTYTVVFKENLRLDEAYTGLINLRTKEIQIDPLAPDLEETLVHEKLEQIKEAYQLKNLDHDLLSQISFGITEFLRHDLNITFDWSDIKEVT